MAVKATTLWTLQTVRDWVGITDAGETVHDGMLEEIADGVTEFIERYTRRKYVTRTLIEIHHGDGSKYLHLRYYPVVTFTSLTILRSPTDASPETVSTTYYVVTKEQGEVYLHSDRLTRGRGNVTATYSVGYGTQGNDALPQDIMMAGKELVKLIYKEKTSGVIGVQAVNIGPLTVTLNPRWPKQIYDVLEVWRRPF